MEYVFPTAVLIIMTLAVAKALKPDKEYIEWQKRNYKHKIKPIKK